MSETKEVEEALKEKPLTSQDRLSPTCINTFYKCPRNYFYTYIAKLRSTNINMVKGGIVHKTLEDFFRAYKAPLRATMEECFEKSWQSQQNVIKNLELSDTEKSAAMSDCYEMIESYYQNFIRKCESLIKAEKAENEQHAYYLLKPKFREMFVEVKDLHCCGYIDRIDKDYDGVITLGDYKTSKKFGIGLPQDYKRQLAIYSLLYNLQKKEMPDFVSVIFLRYGEEYFLEVTPSLLRYARDTINDIYGKTRSIKIEDYPLMESPLCKWCDQQKVCSGQASWEEKLRVQKLKESIEGGVKDGL